MQICVWMCVFVCDQNKFLTSTARTFLQSEEIFVHFLTLSLNFRLNTQVWRQHINGGLVKVRIRHIVVIVRVRDRVWIKMDYVFFLCFLSCFVLCLFFIIYSLIGVARWAHKKFWGGTQKNKNHNWMLGILLCWLFCKQGYVIGYSKIKIKQKNAMRRQNVHFKQSQGMMVPYWTTFSWDKGGVVGVVVGVRGVVSGWLCPYPGPCLAVPLFAKHTGSTFVWNVL